MAGGFLLWSVPTAASDSPALPYHVPVLAAAVREWATGSARAVDATLGGGGHAAILRESGATLPGIDRDPAAIAAARDRLGASGIQYLNTAFAAPAALAAIYAFRPDRILLDLGVSSHQIDSTERGFTFRPGAALDMRMGGRGKEEEGRGITAADILNSWSAEQLTTVFTDYADERRGRALAKQIVRRRLSAAFAISDDFVNAIRAVLGPRSGPSDFARLFQALRIAVNQEIETLVAALPARRHHLSLRRRPRGQARVSRVGSRLHLSAQAAGLHVPGPGVGSRAHQKADPAGVWGNRRESTRPIGA